VSTTRSTHAVDHGSAHRLPTATGRPLSTSSTTAADEAVDPVLALLQQHQVSQISPKTIAAAESRLHDALDEARRGRRVDPALLLQQLATDLGITLSLT
jgi:hypothetical protein